MNFSGLNALVALAPPPPPAGTQRNPTGDLVYMLGMFAILGLMFYFVLIRPQQKKAREHAALLKALRPGDKVLTNGGILGVIVSVKEKSVSIRSADAKFEILKSAVSEITEKAASSAES
ncbi:MAG: preprotein translocase subunit YajC [Verrucomicrobia bacterium]|nr:preprotein translocase subunit YajC [Verrucomicrobiota bacterium]